MSPTKSALRPVIRLAAALVAAAALLIPATAATAVPAPASHAQPHGPLPTIVLEHGAWADASSWSGVIARLQGDGYTVIAPPNPLRGLSSDSAYLSDVLATISGPIVLVGHSYGGAVITNAATGDPNVKALVYVDAFAPDQGEIVNALAGAGSALAADPSTLFDIRPYPGAAAGDADAYLKPSVFVNSFAQDLPRSEALELAATQRPIALSAGNEPSGVPAWKTIPSWYLVGMQDKIITPASQLAMAQRAGSHIAKVNASHVSLISHPGAVVDLVESAVRATD